MEIIVAVILIGSAYSIVHYAGPYSQMASI